MGISHYALLATLFTTHPGAARVDRAVEAIVDRGVIVEMIVRCQNGTAIMSYSKIERRYCTPQFECFSNIDVTIRRSCGE